jgi:hypothetical protein
LARGGWVGGSVFEEVVAAPTAVPGAEGDVKWTIELEVVFPEEERPVAALANPPTVAEG